MAGLLGDLDSPRPSGNDLRMDQISPLPALPQDEVRVGAWAEVRELLELQLAPLGRRGLAALAPHPGESVLDIGCGGGETALDLVRAVAPGLRAATLPAVRSALAAHDGPDGVRLNAATWVVTARAPAGL